MVMRYGVLALQGDWNVHLQILRTLGCDARPIRCETELECVDGLVLPGGESTAMLRLMQPERLDERIIERIGTGLTVLATCAGVILLATGVEPEQPSFGCLDVDVRRNAFGRQVHSEIAPVDLDGELGSPATSPGVFIRAPRLTRVGPEITVLGRRDDEPVLVRQGRLLAATYHPELTDDDRVHRLFVAMTEDGHE